MTMKEVAYKLEALGIKLWAINSLALAVNDALIEGPNSAGNFEGALYILTNAIHEAEQDANVLTKEAFDTARAEKKVG